MSGQLKWDHSQAASAVSSLGAAKSDISGDSVKSPTGCGWSASSASKVVSNLQSRLSSLQSNIPTISTNLSTADKNMGTVDSQSASTVPSSSTVPPSHMTSSGPLVPKSPSSGSAPGPGAGGVKPQFSVPQSGSSSSGGSGHATATRPNYPTTGSDPLRN